MISLFFNAPVPAGISLPIITFSFNPVRLSVLADTAASVSTLVVSWNEAAEIKLSVFKDARVIPNSKGDDVAGKGEPLQGAKGVGIAAELYAKSSSVQS